MVLYVPDLGAKLLSIAAVIELGMTVHFVESLVNLNNFDKTVIVWEKDRSDTQPLGYHSKSLR
jgi:hypothetical protein